MAKKPKSPAKRVTRHSPEHFLNRELQTLEFNRRVLAQAEDRSVPLLERLRFLCIVSSNLDEFFEIRLSGVKEQIKLASGAAGPDGLTPLEVFRQVSARAQGIVELQTLEFNRRVLAQAEDRSVPLLERLRFLCIVSSNLDEFFEIRLSGVKEQIKLASGAAGPDGLTPLEVFRQVSARAQGIVERQYRLFNEEILPSLAKEGIRFLRRAEWTPGQQEWIRDYFFREAMPVLTPIGLDPAHPFPRVFNKSLNFAVELEGRDAFGRDSRAAIVQAPRVLPRVIRLPKNVAQGPTDFIFLSSILHQHVGELFAGMNELGCYQFRVTRNSDLFVEEEEVKDLRQALQGELPQRHFGDAVRLEVADNMSESMTRFLLGQFGLEGDDLYVVAGPVNLVRLMIVIEQIVRAHI